ncbi:hypothetical protein Golomagni_05130 [Golovinomyces magnicellulatus]|nr:hypothetical protein Golomagni_05130 [Golovinomyces magnicellulatus]
MAPASHAWNGAVEKRVSKTATVLSNVKAIKMIGLASLVQTLLRGLRKAEIAQSIAVRKIEVNKIGTLPLIFVFTPMITIAGALFWTTLSDGLDSTNVFVLMSYLFLIYEPLVYLLNYIPTIGSVSACFARVQDFLLLQEHVDSRTMKPCENPDVAVNGGTVVVGSAFSEPNACISLENTSIDSKVPNKPILQHVNVGIERSSIVMVIGPVASGKSTLLRTIIGESMPANGDIQIDGSSIAYAGQSAWLPNDTIRKTILGSNAFESVWYSIVTWACELEEDIVKLTDGDQTIIGSNGSALSGGQRQRLALARAVYSRASILVLDDIISALDHTTALSIIVKLFGPEGLLKSQGRTVIMATHSVQYLSVADQVLTIDAEGNVLSEMGQSSLPDFEQASPADAEAEQITAQKLPAIPKEVKQLHNERGFYGSRNGDFSLYPFFLQDVSKRQLFGFFFLTALSTFLERSTPIYLSIWIKLDPTNKALLAGLGVIGLACIVVSMAKSRLYFIGIIPIISWSMHDKFLNTTLNATLPFLTSTGLGSLLSRAGQDVTLLGHELPMAFYRVVYMSGIVLTDTGVILASTRYAAVMLPIIIILIVIIQSFYLRTSRQIRNLELEAKTPLYEKISETMTGLEHIRCFGWTSQTLKDSFSLLDDAQKPYYYLLSLQRWLGLVLDTSTTMVGTIIVSIAVMTPQNTSNHSLGLSLNALFAYSIGLMAFVEKWTTLETSLGAVARLRDFTTKTPVEKDGPDVQDQPENWGQTGRVELKNVTAQYKLDKKVHTALEGIKLTVEPGQKVVIKGRTGSGKSSLILTLLNFLDYSGTILIDGVDIKTVPRSQLRHRITTISQDIPLIPGSVRDNILPLDMLKPPGEEGKVNEGIVGHILECVGLWDHIDSRGGLDAPIEDMEFSAGQKQLLSLARGMLHHLEYDSMIVLMDEATSNMDFGTDAVMQGVMDASFGDCTRFIISHRSLPMIDCSIYLEFADGKLIHEVDVAKWRVDDEISRRIRAERAANNGEGSSNAT